MAPPELFDPEYEVDLTDAGPDLGVIPGVRSPGASPKYVALWPDRVVLTGRLGFPDPAAYQR